MFDLINKEVLTVLYSVIACRKLLNHERSVETYSNVSPHFLRVLAASLVLYNRTERNQGFSICFIIKNTLNSTRITLNSQYKLYFQSGKQYGQDALYSHKSR